MTRRIGTVVRSPAADKPAFLRPLRPSRNLTEEIIERIAGEIRSGRLGPGSRLPTEQKLMDALRVSRTVIREAVAALRAEGLVTTRQGSGAFVAADGPRAFRIDPDGLSSITDVLNLMELRLAVEVESASLAAERARSWQTAAIMKALADMETAIASGDSAVNEDFAFHRAIADATRNPQFVEFLAFLGQHVIPRHSIRAALATAAERQTYLARLLKEHRRIADAIRGRDGAEARRAMRAHLTKSLERYRLLAERAGEPA
ncbi:MAG TPA: FadR/GntR family transcriptional regulator [Hyphomicrobiaceae bacterium]|nr:FadR/GntR family transcriptional regulator [Hyphomicrobiaceae bacterium]